MIYCWGWCGGGDLVELGLVNLSLRCLIRDCVGKRRRLCSIGVGAEGMKEYLWGWCGRMYGLKLGLVRGSIGDDFVLDLV